MGKSLVSKTKPSKKQNKMHSKKVTPGKTNLILVGGVICLVGSFFWTQIFVMLYLFVFFMYLLVVRDQDLFGNFAPKMVVGLFIISFFFWDSESYMNTLAILFGIITVLLMLFTYRKK